MCVRHLGFFETRKFGETKRRGGLTAGGGGGKRRARKGNLKEKGL